jgi:hypothetical protein
MAPSLIVKRYLFNINTYGTLPVISQIMSIAWFFPTLHLPGALSAARDVAYLREGVSIVDPHRLQRSKLPRVIHQQLLNLL